MAITTVVNDLTNPDGRIIIADATPPALQLVYDPVLGTWHTQKSDAGRISNTNYVWNTSTLAWVKMTQAAGGGGDASEATLAKIPGLSIPIHDAISQSQTSTTDVFTYFVGGLAGTLVATVTVTYTDATKAIIQSVVKT